jgi:hypothetical protein
MMANAVIDTAMAGRLSAIDSCLGRHRRFDHEHCADDADQRVARTASDGRPQGQSPLRSPLRA